MLIKYSISILIINFGLLSLGSAAAIPTPSGSNNLVPQNTSPKKKVVFIDYAHTMQRDFTVGCPSGSIATGISKMPKQSGNFSKSAPISHNAYKFNITRTEAACLWVKIYWNEYKTYNPSWVTGFSTPQLTCAPITVAWQG